MGVLTGSPLTDVRISLIAGRAHVKHTEGGDFREAVYRAVRQGLMKAKSVLLEPWYDFRIEVLPEQIGRAISDVRAMSGKFDTEGSSVITGIAPVSEMNGYAETLASYTSGKGRIVCRAAGYYPCHNEKQVIESIGYDPEADVDNTPDSVFCSHGAGTVVKWNETEKYIHLNPDLGGEKAPEEFSRPRYFPLTTKSLKLSWSVNSAPCAAECIRARKRRKRRSIPLRRQSASTS